MVRSHGSTYRLSISVFEDLPFRSHPIPAGSAQRRGRAVRRPHPPTSQLARGAAVSFQPPFSSSLVISLCCTRATVSVTAPLPPSPTFAFRAAPHPARPSARSTPRARRPSSRVRSFLRAARKSAVRRRGGCALLRSLTHLYSNPVFAVYSKMDANLKVVRKTLNSAFFYTQRRTT